jgi:glycosyltransferase involved in cell wall biosynthesis
VSEYPLISIIVLCHNYERFLAQAIDSALAQTYPNCEVVVMDDGSTDDSVEVASRYGDAVRLLTQPNQGLERAANRAVSEAAGELFAFLSADDYFEPAYVETLYEGLRRAPDASYSYCRARMFGSRTGLIKGFPFSPYLLIKLGNFVNGSALTVRRDYLDLGGYDPALSDFALEDWDLWLRMVEHGRRGTFVPEPLLNWRRHELASRNPEEDVKLERSSAVIRERHSVLYRSVSDLRGRLYYLVDLCVAVIDLGFRLSRWPRVLNELERRSWRRFQRRHADALRVFKPSRL